MSTIESPVTCDADAWERWPHHRGWFNRLDLAMRLGHNAGPCGTAPAISGDFVVRPIYNLSGMGVGARIVRATAGDHSLAPPGYFWCERFMAGHQLSIDYVWTVSDRGAGWEVETVWQGIVDPYDLTQFREWRWLAKSAVKGVHLPGWFNELQDVSRINVEAIAGKIIEVHLRSTQDPQDGDLLIPVYADRYPPTIPPGYVWHPDYDDADGHMKIPRLGFLKRVERIT